jgi:hypothetical protein
VNGYWIALIRAANGAAPEQSAPVPLIDPFAESKIDATPAPVTVAVEQSATPLAQTLAAEQAASRPSAYPDLSPPAVATPARNDQSPAPVVAHAVVPDRQDNAAPTHSGSDLKESSEPPGAATPVAAAPMPAPPTPVAARTIIAVPSAVEPRSADLPLRQPREEPRAIERPQPTPPLVEALPNLFVPPVYISAEPAGALRNVLEIESSPVTVSIGRLEVRISPPSSPASPAPRARRAATAPDLSDYLNGRLR